MSEGEQKVAREWAPAIKDLGDKISQLTLVQGKELADYLKEAYGIEPAAGGAVLVAQPGGGGGQAAPEEPSTFDVVLTEIGARKINVIKAVREETGLGLKEAKDLVEAVPSKIKEGLPKEEAQKLKTKLEEQGAKVELK